MIVQLRKVCNHPWLFDIDADEDFKTPLGMVPDILGWSGKMLLLDQLLTKLLAAGHRVLIFSQMTKMLDIIADYLELYKKLDHCRIDGSTKQTERQIEIAKFNNSAVPVFILSTRAGGLGINLTAADTVIIFDSDWNPQVDLQAMDRVHRIGQTKPVVVYRFITASSIEQRILARAREKRTLEKLVISKSNIETNKKMSSRANREPKLP